MKQHQGLALPSFFFLLAFVFSAWIDCVLANDAVFELVLSVSLRKKRRGSRSNVGSKV